ncbi:hypothetical protein AX17_001872 [Amanita inopinata Kibby_2008]|nr:hypothetical protein AX17_001872 [Amanita inopinata Kibby_2008]
MIAFVTVGSTGFDSLIEAALSKSFLNALHDKGFKRLVVQCGNSNTGHEAFRNSGDQVVLSNDGIEIELWKYKPVLQAEYEKADMVISHAGSGTILEVLRLCKPLIVVPNPTLLDNHQEELAWALENLGFLRTSTVCDLVSTIKGFDPKECVQFPSFDGSRIARIVDEEMGFL